MRNRLAALLCKEMITRRVCPCLHVGTCLWHVSQAQPHNQRVAAHLLRPEGTSLHSRVGRRRNFAQEHRINSAIAGLTQCPLYTEASADPPPPHGICRAIASHFSSHLTLVRDEMSMRNEKYEQSSNSSYFLNHFIYSVYIDARLYKYLP